MAKEERHGAPKKLNPEEARDLIKAIEEVEKEEAEKEEAGKEDPEQQERDKES